MKHITNNCQVISTKFYSNPNRITVKQRDLRWQKCIDVLDEGRTEFGEKRSTMFTSHVYQSHAGVFTDFIVIMCCQVRESTQTGSQLVERRGWRLNTTQIPKRQRNRLLTLNRRVLQHTVKENSQCVRNVLSYFLWIVRNKRWAPFHFL